MPIKTVLSEYTRYRKMAEMAIEQISDAQLFSRFGGGENSVAIIVNHLSGNLLSRFTDFLTTDGEKPWRHRETEFAPPAEDRVALLARWEEAWQVVEANVGTLTAAHLEQEASIRGKGLTVIAALHRSMAHVAYHVGQIVLMSRHYAGADWTFLSIPPGQSDAYNQNPDREIAPR